MTSDGFDDIKKEAADNNQILNFKEVTFNELKFNVCKLLSIKKCLAF